MSSPTRPPLSVLDLAIVRADGSSRDALVETTELAQHAERLGYLRFWVAEHHNMPSVASTTPPVLMAHLAARTQHIRIGSGGIMLPNHPPLVVAEHIAALEALHPGRIDLGIGRAPGTDLATAAALRRSQNALGTDDFLDDLVDLMGLLGDERGDGGLWQRFSATPKPTSRPLIVLLGSSGYSAQVAGVLGLPFAFAHHFDMGGTLQALDLYREAFRPSVVLDSPYAIVTANVLVADTEEQAEYEAAPGKLMIYGVRTGRFSPLLSPEEAAVHPQLAAAKAMPSNRIVGSPSVACEQLDELATSTGADELMISTVAHSIATRQRSLELLARAWSSDRAAA